MTNQQKADELLRTWQANRHLPPAERFEKSLMSMSLQDMQIPRGRLLLTENGVEIEIPKRDLGA